jgi:hypothetical protein
MIVIDILNNVLTVGEITRRVLYVCTYTYCTTSRGVDVACEHVP